MKYIVMERHESYVIVLDEKGRFYKVANMDYTPGQTLTKVVPMADVKAKRRRRAGFFALFLILLALAGTCLWFFLFSGAFAGVDENAVVYRFYMGGEIAVTCDNENNVKKIEGLDEGGKAVAQLDTGNKNVIELSIEMLEKAYSMGYVTDDDEIYVAIENEEDDDDPKLEAVADILEEYSEEKYDIEVEKSSWKDYLKDTAKGKYLGED